MENQSSNFFVARGFGEIKEFVDSALNDMEPDKTITFGGIVDHWGNPVTPEYFRTLVSKFGKAKNRYFSVKVLPPLVSGEGFAKVKRVR